MASQSPRAPQGNRYRAVDILLEANIPCLIWAEDALRLYGVPTVLLDLFLLVEDHAVAVQALTASGLFELVSIGDYGFIPELSDQNKRQARVQQKDRTSDPTHVRLLPASSWSYPWPLPVRKNLEPMTEDGISTGLFPTLSNLLTSLIDAWLAAVSIQLASHLGTHIGYLFRYASPVRNTVSNLTSHLSPFHRLFVEQYQMSAITLVHREAWRKKRESLGAHLQKGDNENPTEGESSGPSGSCFIEPGMSTQI